MPHGEVRLSTDGDRIRVRVTILQSRERVWALLTEPKHIARWWGSHVDFEPGAAGRLVERWRDGDREVVTHGHVTEWQPPSVLGMRWADEDWSVETQLAIELTGADGRTELTLAHVGWIAFPDTARPDLVRAHGEGWSHHMTNLVAYAAQRTA